MNVTFVSLGYTSCGGKSHMWVLITAEIDFHSLPHLLLEFLSLSASVTVLGAAASPAPLPTGSRWHTSSSVAASRAPTWQKARGMARSPSVTCLPAKLWSFGLVYAPCNSLGWRWTVGFIERHPLQHWDCFRSRAIALIASSSTGFSALFSHLMTPRPEAAETSFSSSQSWLWTLMLTFLFPQRVLMQPGVLVACFAAP